MERDYDELHIVVTAPSLGMFVARKITDPEKLVDDTYIDRTTNSLQQRLERKGIKGVEVLCRRVKK